jgi:hypothetical protein
MRAALAQQETVVFRAMYDSMRGTLDTEQAVPALSELLQRCKPLFARASKLESDGTLRADTVMEIATPLFEDLNSCRDRAIKAEDEAGDDAGAKLASVLRRFASGGMVLAPWTFRRRLSCTRRSSKPARRSSAWVTARPFCVSTIARYVCWWAVVGKWSTREASSRR